MFYIDDEFDHNCVSEVEEFVVRQTDFHCSFCYIKCVIFKFC